jgi:hypothetical protein
MEISTFPENSSDPIIQQFPILLVGDHTLVSIHQDTVRSIASSLVWEGDCSKEDVWEDFESFWYPLTKVWGELPSNALDVCRVPQG